MEEMTLEQYRQQFGTDPIDVPASPQGLSRTARNLGAGIIEAIPQAVGFLGTTVPALAQTSYDYFSSQMGQDSFMERVAQRHMIPGGMQAVQQLLEQRVADVRRDVPDATPEELTQYVNEFKQSKAFYDAMTPQFHPTMRFSRNASSFANDVVGIPESPEEQTGWDSAERIIGGALVGLPRSIVAGAGKALGTSAMGGALASGPAAVAGRVVEAVTPLTLPLTIPNVALNAGAGILLDSGIRYAMGETTVFGENPTPGLIVAGGVLAAGALMVLGGGRGVIGKAVTPDVNPSTAAPNATNAVAPSASGLEPPPPATNPSSSFTASNIPPPPDMPNAPAPQPGAGTLREQSGLAENFAGVMDYAQMYGNEFHAIKQLARIGGRTDAEIYAAEATFSNNSGAAAIPQIDAAIARGEYSGIEFGNFTGLETLYSRLDEPRVQRLTEGLNAGDLLENIGELIANNKKRMGELQAEIGYLQGTEDPIKKAQLTRLTTELTNRQSAEALASEYAPSYRMGNVDQTKAELQARVNAMMNDPLLAQIKGEYQKIARGSLDLQLQAGTIDGTAHRKLRDRNNYVPRSEDQYPGLTGVRRWLSQFGDLLKQDLRMRDIGGSDLNAAGRRVDDLLDVPDAFKINYASNPVENLKNNLRSTLSQAVEIKRRNAIVELIATPENIKAGHIRPITLGDSPNNVFTQEAVRGSPELQSYVQKAGMLDPPVDSAYLVHQYPGGNVRILQFANKDVRNVVMGLPNPELGIMGYSAQLWKHGTTGLLNPLFRFTSMMWDNMFAMLFRNEGREFGLIQAGLSRALGEKIGNSAAVQMLSAVDPSTIFQSLAGSARLYAGNNSIKASHHIANALLDQDSLWSKIADKVGRPQFERMVHNWVKAADNSMVSQFQRAGAGLGLTNGELLGSGRNQFANLLPKMPPVLQATVSQYKMFADAIDSGTKFAFYSQNMAKMGRAVGGAANVDDAAKQQLLFETRTISGDMSRRSASQALRKMEQIVPYQSAIRNSLTFVYGNFYRGLTDIEYAKVIWPRMVAYGTASMGMMYGYMSMSQSNRDHFFEGLTDWQRAQMRPYPANAETALAMITRQPREYNSADWLWIREAPELNVFSSTIMAGLQAFGLMPTSEREGRQWSPAYQAMMNTITPPPPPLMQAALAANGYRIDFGRLADGSSAVRSTTPEVLAGSLADKMYSNNVGGISRTMADMLNAVIGTSGGILASMLDAAKTTHADAGPIAPLQAFFNEGVQQAVRIAPDVPGLWNTEDRMFLQNGADKKVKDALQNMNAISMTWARTMGDAVTDRRGDPSLGPNVPMISEEFQPIVQAINRFGKSSSSEFAQAQDARTQLMAERRQIQSNYQFSMGERLQRLNDNSVRIRDIRLNQENLISTFEADLTEKHPALAQQLGGAITLDRVVAAMQQSMRPSDAPTP